MAVVNPSEFYDMVIDVDSLVSLAATGWEVRVKDPQMLGELNGRWISFIGDSNVGKTHIIQLIMERNLGADQTTHTRGLSAILPIEKSTTNSNQPTLQELLSAPEVKDDPNDSKFAKNRKEKLRAEIKQKWKIQNDKVRALIILDTEGASVSYHVLETKDRRYKDRFLREAILNLADRPIFVLSKFDAKAQNDIGDLLNHLNNRNRPATDQNPLIIIHNHKDVLEKEQLRFEIENVERCYYIDPEDPKAQAIPDPYPNKASWSPLKPNMVYQSKVGLHYFIVNQPKSSDDAKSGEWRSAHNKETIDHLKEYLFNNVNAQRKSMINEFVKYGTTMLRNIFVKEFKELQLKLGYLVDDNVIAALKPEKPVDEDAENLYPNLDNYQPVDIERFTLNEVIIDDGGSIRTHTDFPLKATIIESVSEYVVLLETPGLSPTNLKTHVKVRAENNRKIWVDVLFYPPKLEQSDLLLVGSAQIGTGRFYHKFSKQGKFENIPRDLTERYSGKFMSVANGILTIHLQKELPEYPGDTEPTKDSKKEKEKEKETYKNEPEKSVFYTNKK